MTYSDVVKNFEVILICNMDPDVLDQVAHMADIEIAPPKHTWKTQMVTGKFRNLEEECKRHDDDVPLESESVVFQFCNSLLNEVVELTEI